MKTMLTMLASLLFTQTLHAQQTAELTTKIEQSTNKNEATVTITNPSLRRMPIQRTEPMGGKFDQDEFRQRSAEARRPFSPPNAPH